MQLEAHVLVSDGLSNSLFGAHNRPRELGALLGARAEANAGRRRD